MKNRSILLALCLFFVPSSVWAQDSVIRVIQPDGSVIEAEMPKPKTPSQSEPSQAAPPQVQPAPLPEVLPSDLAVSPPVTTPKAKKPAKKFMPAKSVKTPSAKPQKGKTPKAAQDLKPAPLPEPDALGKSMLPPRAKPEAAPGEYISKAQALRIALDYAPPARTYDVLPRTYDDGRFIYIVRFATEAGSRDILIDAKDGAIINKAR